MLLSAAVESVCLTVVAMGLLQICAEHSGDDIRDVSVIAEQTL